ncbi:MAG: YidC/Oxa1 family membrane protein insertase [Clostridiales bacterium]|nr:YidC/Oxa1 family membrane protein insertase [Clostridiales bacterium]
MNAIYNILGVPFGFALRLIYNLVGHYGVSIILFTLFCRLLMLPTTISQQKGTAKTYRLQPKLRKIREKYGNDQRKIQEETQALYQREGYNPMGAGCAPLLIQMPIIFGLIAVIYRPLTYALGIASADVDVLTTALTTHLSDVVSNIKNTRIHELLVIQNIDKLSGFTDVTQKVSQSVIDQIKNFNFTMFGLELGEIPSFKEFNKEWIVPVLSGLSALASGIFTTIKQRQQNPDMSKNPMMGCMALGMPLISFYFAFQFPIGIGIYWITSNVLAFIQQVIISYTHSPQKMIAKAMVEETIERRSKENFRKKINQNLKNQ